MGEMTDKAKAAGNKLAGNVKEGIGKMTDNERLEAEGKAQQLHGLHQVASGGSLLAHTDSPTGRSVGSATDAGDAARGENPAMPRNTATIAA